MKAAWMLLLPPSIVSLFASEPIPEINGWAQLGTVGVVSALLCYLIMRHIPQQNKEHRQEIKDQQERFLAALKSQAESFERQLKEFQK